MNCKLIGQYIQYLEVTLSPGEVFFAERGSLILTPGKFAAAPAQHK